MSTDSSYSELRAVSSAERTLDPRTLASMRSAGQRKARQKRIAQSSPPEVTSGIVCFCGERFREDRALEFMLHLRAEYGEVLEWQEKVRGYWRKSYQQRTSDPEKRTAVQTKRNERTRKRRADPELGGLLTDLEREARYRWLSNPEARAKQSARRKRQLEERKQQKDATCPICGEAYAQYMDDGRPETCSSKCGSRLRWLRVGLAAGKTPEQVSKERGLPLPVVLAVAELPSSLLAECGMPKGTA